MIHYLFFFFQAEDGIRDLTVTGVQTCALPILNDLSVAVAGEAARVHLIVQRGGVPAGAAVSSGVWTRVAEGLALALFLVMAPSVLQLERWLRGVQSAGGLAVVVGVLLAWGRGWAALAARLPASLPAPLAPL